MSMQRSAWCRKIGIMLGKIFVCLTPVRMTLGVWGLWCKKLEHEGNKIISGARCHNRGPGLMYNIAAIFWQHGIWTLTQVIDEDIHKMLARVKVKFGNIKIYIQNHSEWGRNVVSAGLMTLFNPASTQGSATAVLLCPPARSLSAVFWWDATEVSYSFPIICTNCNELVSWQGPLPLSSWTTAIGDAPFLSPSCDRNVSMNVSTNGLFLNLNIYLLPRSSFKITRVWAALLCSPRSDSSHLGVRGFPRPALHKMWLAPTIMSERKLRQS